MTKQEILNKIKMPEEGQAFIFEVLDKIYANEEYLREFKEIKDEFFALEIDEIKKDNNDFWPHLEAFGAKLGYSFDQIALPFCIECTDVTEKRMREQGFGDEDIIANLVDIVIWAKICERDWGGWGMHEFSWVSRSLRAILWRLGRLQFEISEFEADEFNKYGVHIKRGDKVINTHIPEDGPMPDDQRLDAYKRAYEYFGFGHFVCDTYLLYPRQREFLPKDSNIVRFMDEFEAVKSGELEGHNNMWRIWGQRDNWDPATLPRNTRLQRAYADHLAKHNCTGWGYGVMIFDGEKIVKE